MKVILPYSALEVLARHSLPLRGWRSSGVFDTAKSSCREYRSEIGILSYDRKNEYRVVAVYLNKGGFLRYCTQKGRLVPDSVMQDTRNPLTPHPFNPLALAEGKRHLEHSRLRNICMLLGILLIASVILNLVLLR